MQKLTLALVLGIGFVALGACGASAPQELVMDISMAEFTYSPDVIQAKVGQQVTLNLTNTGALQHEIMFGRTAMMMGDQPSGYEMDMFSMAGMDPAVTFSAGMEGIQDDMLMGEAGMQHGGFAVIMPVSDQMAQMTFMVTSEMVGEWEFGCFEQDGVHYTAGMTGRMVVTP
jgi:plastocyanin